MRQMTRIAFRLNVGFYSVSCHFMIVFVVRNWIMHPANINNVPQNLMDYATRTTRHHKYPTDTMSCILRRRQGYINKTVNNSNASIAQHGYRIVGDTYARGQRTMLFGCFCSSPFAGNARHNMSHMSSNKIDLAYVCAAYQ